MLEKIRVVFTVPELRNKILVTLLFLAVFRIGTQIPLPVVDQTMAQFTSGADAGLANMLTAVATFSATTLDNVTIFGLGIMPYISASIILQILATVWKPLEELQKEGETGRKKINEYTRYLTVILCIVQSWVYLSILEDQQMLLPGFLKENGGLKFNWTLLCVLTMTCGTVFMMWLGEQIDEWGIGNGISLLIMAGILARMPAAGRTLLSPMLQGELELGGGVEKLIVLAVLFVSVVAGVVFIYMGQRRIPTQSAKHVRGRRVMGGTRQYLPLKVIQSGVMPIIFASSLLMFPALLLGWISGLFPNSAFWANAQSAVSSSSAFTHNLLYVLLIYFFCYFWTAITFNPKDISENLRSYGTFIPGYRPGRRTADYLEKVMVRITYVGAGFLAIVAIMPTLVAGFAGIEYQTASFYGGTGLLIAVSVAFDLVQKIDSHLIMRNYKGLLEDS